MSKNIHWLVLENVQEQGYQSWLERDLLGKTPFPGGMRRTSLVALGLVFLAYFVSGMILGPYKWTTNLPEIITVKVLAVFVSYCIFQLLVHTFVRKQRIKHISLWNHITNMLIGFNIFNILELAIYFLFPR